MGSTLIRIFIEPLDLNRHDIQSFQCGKSRLDDLLHNSEHLNSYGKTYIVVLQPGDSEIIACFTLLPSPLDIMAGDEQATKFTAVLLNLLAVDYRYQKQGIGKRVIFELMVNIVQTAETHPLDYLLVLPLDEEAAGYYKHLNLGFVSLADGSLILPVEVMRQALRSVLEEDAGGS
jgi:predicted N-acetyltransferase YhbS